MTGAESNIIQVLYVTCSFSSYLHFIDQFTPRTELVYRVSQTSGTAKRLLAASQRSRRRLSMPSIRTAASSLSPSQQANLSHPTKLSPGPSGRLLSA